MNDDSLCYKLDNTGRFHFSSSYTADSRAFLNFILDQESIIFSSYNRPSSPLISCSSLHSICNSPRKWFSLASMMFTNRIISLCKSEDQVQRPVNRCLCKAPGKLLEVAVALMGQLQASLKTWIRQHNKFGDAVMSIQHIFIVMLECKLNCKILTPCRREMLSRQLQKLLSQWLQ